MNSYKTLEYICSICYEKCIGYGNNAEPVKKGRCCDDCNYKYVLAERFGKLTK